MVSIPEGTAYALIAGVDSISLNHDTVIKTKQIIASAEQRVMLERLQKLEAKMSELDEYIG